MSDDTPDSASSLLAAVLAHGHRHAALLGASLGPRTVSPARTAAANGFGFANLAAADIAETAEAHGISEFAVVRRLQAHGVLALSLPAETTDSA